MSATIAPAERRAIRTRLAAVEALPVRTELGRAVLGLLSEAAEAAWAARDRAGRDAMRRGWLEGVIAAFDVLVLETDREDVQAAFGWAARRMIATMEAIRPPELA